MDVYFSYVSLNPLFILFLKSCHIWPLGPFQAGSSLKGPSFSLLIFFYCVDTKLHPALATSWTVALQALLFMGFPRQEYSSGLPFPSPWDFPDPGIKPMSAEVQAVSSFVGEPLPMNHQGSLLYCLYICCFIGLWGQ